MGKVTYFIDHYMYIPKPVKAQLSLYLPGEAEVGKAGVTVRGPKK